MELEKVKTKVKHYQAGNRSVQQIMSKVRRWILSDVGRGNPAIVLYDYLKLTGEKLIDCKVAEAVVSEEYKIASDVPELSTIVLVPNEVPRTSKFLLKIFFKISA